MCTEVARSFIGYEFDANAKATGKQFVYFAPTREQAVALCLRNERLTDSDAFVGPTGYVVYGSEGRRISFPAT